MPLRTRYLIYILLLATGFRMAAINLHFNQISTQDGLSQNTVRTVLTDRKGFIWAGTLEGINRYDGYRIKVYKPQPGDENTLIDHRIRSLYQDRDGYIWIKTYRNEFSCYNPISDTFIEFIPDSLRNSYNEYYEASNGDIWLWGENQGCLQIEKKGGGFRSIPYLTTGSDTEKKALFLYEDAQSMIWIGTKNRLYRLSDGKLEEIKKKEYILTGVIEIDDHLYFMEQNGYILKYDKKSQNFNPVKYDNDSIQFRHIAYGGGNRLLISTDTEGIVCFDAGINRFEKPEWTNHPQLKGNIDFIVDMEKNVWLYNLTGMVWYYNTQHKSARAMTLIPPDIVQTIDLERYNIFIDSEGLIWITTYGNGLFTYDKETETLTNYKYTDNQNSPASNYLLDLTEDKYGNIWVGSEYAGLIKVVKSGNNIRIVRPEEKTALGKNNNVRMLYRDSYNHIWTGTKSGNLYLYDNNLERIEKVFKDIIPYAMAEDADKNIWVGTKVKGLYIIERATMNIRNHFTGGEATTQLSNASVFSLLRDRKNRMWIGTFGGGINLAEHNGEGFTFRRFFNEPGNHRFIRYLYLDSKGFIWACSSDGIITFDPDEFLRNPEAYTHHRMDINNKESLNGNDIKTIYEDSRGNIWIGTAGGGLNKYISDGDHEKGRFISYTTHDGLSGNIISGIMEDKNHRLWISTENGITKFDPESGTFTGYDFSDKTYGNNFNENANICKPEGIMFWGSLDGILVFDPDFYTPDQHKPPVILTNFLIYDQPAKVGKNAPLQQSVSYANDIRLNYQQNTFTIEFASQDLREPKKSKYMYILEDYDKQWSQTSHDHAATYKNLSPGKYVFKVKGTNYDGIWNEEISEINITITPPIWKTWYARLFYFILFMALLYLAFRLIVKFNTLNNKVEVEKELTNHKLRFFTNISHEFRTPLTLIRGAIENMNEMPGTPPEMKRQISLLGRNSNILTRLIDQLLEFRKLQNNVLKLDLTETDMISFSREIYIGFLDMAKQKNIKYLFSAGQPCYRMFIDHRKVDKILYNLLSNAFKFTPKEGTIELKISFDENRRTCLIAVCDNGIGIDKDKQHMLFSRFMQINFSSAGTGVGLSLVKEFVDVHKGKIGYENNEGGGSVFIVELSTDPETYKGDNFLSPAPALATTDDHKVITPDTNEHIRIPEIEDSILSNYKMMIIDDNNDILTFLVEEFSKHFMVMTAEDGDAGLEKAKENNPDLIICDVMMPGKDGFEVTRNLKEDFQTCHIPVILLTAHSSIEHQLEGIESGADAYIMKPFSMKYLVARVFKLIEQREQLKKRFSSEYIIDGNLITHIDKDKKFYNLITKILEDHVADPDFSVERFAELAKQRRTIFYNKIKGITGLSPNELIKARRMKRSAELLLEGDLTVAEVAYKVGFDDPFYFSKCFKSQYGCSPSKFGQKGGEKV